MNKNKIQIVSYLLIALFLNACSATKQQSYSYYFDRRELNLPTQNGFDHCHNYGCQLVQNIELSKSQWGKIEKHMNPSAKTPEAERKQIEQAIAAFETIVGKIAKTDEDIYGTFKEMGRFQLDCVDESTNTTSYLVALKERGYILHHDILGPSSRFLRNGFPGWPHQTAVIREHKDKKSFAVDSWFRDNGYPPFIIPLDEWRSGWTPEDHMRPELHETIEENNSK